ncbi:TonB-dependent receptor [Rheinheimera riviphila]|uniref:TonB-dependent receptor n=1 Tax=Rheinheimera riviphila TaxID=1834037 RepID=A0A437QBG0_9GAMM|nr:TonB-dependent receptor [Rheinheimera riviphila]RVU31894.1 TonB-dependent receptor [Rheinheimera riviphila]
MNHKKTMLALTLAQMFAAPMLLAQQSNEQNTAEPMESITITGSRINRTSAQMSTPTTIVDAATIELSGAKNIGDLIHQLPALANGIGAVSSSDGNGGNKSDAGLELANLRGLGSVRTLVLVDGRRHVPGSANESAVDLSMIPASLIERIEIVTGGASAIYGADAVTGVVNFILKKNFTGVEIDVSAGQTSKSDAKQKDFKLTVGENFANDKLNTTLHLNYSDRDELPMSARGYANANPAFARLGTAKPNDGISDTVWHRDQRFQALSREGLIYLPNAKWVLAGTPFDIINNPLPPTFGGDPFGLGYDTFTIDRDNGKFRPFVSGTNCQIVPCDGGDGFQTPESNSLLTPSTRYLMDFSSHYEVSDQHSLYFDAKYGKVEAAAAGQASVFHDDNFGPLIPLRIDNPFVPAELKQLMTARGINVAALAVVGRPLRTDNTRETMQFTFGSKGLIGEYSYDTFFQHGEVDSELVSQDTLMSRYYEALDATTDASGKAICRSRNSSCAPWNAMYNQVSPEALAYVGVDLLTTEKVEQTLASYSINGDLAELDAGIIGFAAGVEYRKESSQSTPDKLAQAIDADGVGSGLVGSRTGATRAQNSYVKPTSGEYDVKELFGELIVPLLSDYTLIDSLELEAAARVSNHSITGTDSTYKLALNWALTDKIRTRATYSLAVRAPNIAELFAPDSISGARMTDPCHAANRNGGLNPAQRQANCLALGIPANFISEASFGTRSVQTRGNRDLKPEEATTYTLGLVWLPFDRFNLALDYWNIEIEDAITSFDASDVLSNCVDGAALDPKFCRSVSRRADGNINLVSVANINASKFIANGTDLDLSYSLPLSAGSVDTSLVLTYLGEREFWQNPEFQSNALNDAGTSRYPHVRALLRAAYRTDTYTIGWTMNYASKSTFNKTTLNDDAYPDWFDNKVASYAKHNLFLNYNISDDVSTYLNIDNIGDKKPQYLPGINQGTLIYDAVGRRFNLGVKVKF